MKKIQIHYFFDPLCGWCFGFSNHINKFAKEFSSKYEIKPFLGGMVLGDRRMQIADFKDYILKSKDRLESMTGAKFGQDFLEGLLQSNDWLMDSLPPSLLFYYMRERKPELSLEIAHDIQYLIYQEGKNPNLVDNWQSLFDKYKLDISDFKLQAQSPDFIKKLEDEFVFVKSMGVSGYPAMLVNISDNWYQMTSGFVSYDDLCNLDKSIDTHLQKLGK